MTAVRATIPAPVRDRRRSFVVFVVVALAGLTQFLLNIGAYYVYDDWLYFGLARDAGFWSADWLTSVYFQHFAPGHRAANSLQAALPLAYGPVLAFMCGLLAWSGYLLVRALDLLRGASPVHLAIAATTIVSPFFLTAMNWWAAALQMVPTILAGTASLYALARFTRDGRWTWGLLVTLATALGLLFYVRTVLVPGYLVLVSVLLLGRPLAPRAILQRFWKERYFWVAAFAPAFLYLVYYLGLGVTGQTSQPYTTADLAEYLRIAWFKAVAPGLLGVRIQAGDVPSTFQDVAVVVAQVLVLGFVAWTLSRRPGQAARAWTFAFVVFLVNALITGLPRLGPFGPGIASSLRYYTDLAWLLPLAAAFAATGTGLPGPRPTGRAVGAALTALVLILALRTDVTINREWPGSAARLWVANVRAGTEDLPLSFVLADGTTPGYVVYEDYPPYNRVSRILEVLDRPGRQVDGPLRPGASLAAVGPDGTVRPSIFKTVVGGDAVTLQQDGTLVVRGRSERRQGALCVGGDRREARVILRPGGAVDADPAYLRVKAAVATRVAVPVRRTAAPGKANDADLTMTLDPSVPTSLRWLNGTKVTSASLLVPPGVEVCLQRLELGAVIPR